jgi:hypothetical protein
LEAEIGISYFKISLGKKVFEAHLNRKILGVVAHTCHPSYSGKLKIGGSWSRIGWTKKKT